MYKRQIVKEATSKRVLDNFDLSRPFQGNEIESLFNLDRIDLSIQDSPLELKTPMNDDMLADLIKLRECIYEYRDHESLLEIFGKEEGQGDQTAEYENNERQQSGESNIENVRRKKKKTDTNQCTLNPMWSKIGISVSDYLTPKLVSRQG